mmetsp:Transcript_5979/g.8377  ORF Transcript_5979/g.8377 Transcript_5979/m.8377 type:complete len:324 (+) Transcript_5979:33-1004(+)
MLRLVSFLHKSSNLSPKPISAVGSLLVDHVGNPVGLMDLNHFEEDKNPENNRMLQLIDKTSKERRLLSEIREQSADALKRRSFIPISDVILQAPIPVPRRNVMCVGKNYKDHIKEVAAAIDTNVGSSHMSTGMELPKYPQFFSKASNAVIGPNEIIESHSKITKWLDYEAELAVVIGQKCRDVEREKAMDCIFGYTIANDITARDLQKKHNQWFKGKSLDTTCPMGPCIVVASDLSDNVMDLSVKLWVNNEIRQNSRTSNMIFDIAEIIHQLSSGFTLYPGDIILTGTPEGVGFAMKPPRTLQSGDNVEIEIEHIGRLINKVH